MKEPGPEALGAQPWFCLPRDRVSFLTLSRNDLQAAASNITTGPRPASFVSRTPMRPGRSSATSTQLPLQALWELLRHAGRTDAVLTGASSLPPPRPPAAARPLYSRFPALTPVAPYISRQWTARLRQAVTAERSEAATSASYRPGGIPTDHQSGSLCATCAVSGANYTENSRQPTRHGAMRAVTERHISSTAVAAQDPCAGVALRLPRLDVARLTRHRRNGGQTGANRAVA